MYELPIQITTEVQNSIQTDVDESVYKVIQKYGINVDKEELIRALKYDREQYDKGYADGLKDFAKCLLIELGRFDLSRPPICDSYYCDGYQECFDNVIRTITFVCGMKEVRLDEE